MNMTLAMANTKQMDIVRIPFLNRRYLCRDSLNIHCCFFLLTRLHTKLLERSSCTPTICHLTAPSFSRLSLMPRLLARLEHKLFNWICKLKQQQFPEVQGVYEHSCAKSCCNTLLFICRVITGTSGWKTLPKDMTWSLMLFPSCMPSTAGILPAMYVINACNKFN